MGGNTKIKQYTDAEDLTIIRLRNEGKAYFEIAAALGRSREGVRGRYRDITQGKERRPHGKRKPRVSSYTPLSPIWDPQLAQEDDDHVARINRLGGFTRRNQFSAATA